LTLERLYHRENFVILKTRRVYHTMWRVYNHQAFILSTGWAMSAMTHQIKWFFFIPTHLLFFASRFKKIWCFLWSFVIKTQTSHSVIFFLKNYDDRTKSFSNRYQVPIATSFYFLAFCVYLFWLFLIYVFSTINFKLNIKFCRIFISHYLQYCQVW